MFPEAVKQIILTPSAPKTVEQSTNTTTTAKSPPMAPLPENATSTNRIGIRLPFHLPNLCESNQHHHCHQCGGMAGAWSSPRKENNRKPPTGENVFPRK